MKRGFAKRLTALEADAKEKAITWHYVWWSPENPQSVADWEALKATLDPVKDDVLFFIVGGGDAPEWPPAN